MLTGILFSHKATLNDSTSTNVNIVMNY